MTIRMFDGSYIFILSKILNAALCSILSSSVSIVSYNLKSVKRSSNTSIPS